MARVTEKRIEWKIIRAVIKDALAAGYSISVYDGEETPLKRSTKENEIVHHMMTTDEDYLIMHDAEGKRIGWVRFVYGNSGWDVVNDHTTNLDHIMARANELADQYG